MLFKFTIFLQYFTYSIQYTLAELVDWVYLVIEYLLSLLPMMNNNLISISVREKFPMVYNTYHQSETNIDCDIWVNVKLYYMNKLDSSGSVDNTVLKCHWL